MKVISTVEELEAFLARNPGRRADLASLLPVPGENLEQMLMSGKQVMIPETPEEEQEVAAAMLATTVRRIARDAGWKDAARHYLRVGGQPPLTGARLASFAAFLRQKYGG